MARPPSILYTSSRYLVRSSKADRNDVTVVTFDPWSPNPSLEGPFFGEDFFARRGISAIGVKTARNDWYLGAEMVDVVRAIRAATAGIKLVGYGASMGGYAAINQAANLGLDTVLAVGPQFSIDPLKVPFDARYIKEASEITFEFDGSGDSVSNQKGFLVFDPYTIDAQHAALIGSHHLLDCIKISFADHHPLAVLKESGLLEDLVIDVVNDRFDKQLFADRLRKQRNGSQWVWFQISRILLARGNVEGAIRAIQHAKRKSNIPVFHLDLQHGEILVQARRPDEACDIITAHIENPVFADTVRWLLCTWTAGHNTANGIILMP